MDTKKQKTIACLIGGALGDALGRPVERIRTPQLYDYYGPDGIQDMQTVGMRARITDDTQMTLFTSEGLRNSIKAHGKDAPCDMDIIYSAYLNWYITQTEEAPEEYHGESYLMSLPELYSPAGPGRTCLESLKAGVPGSIKNPVNDSHGCGGIMRVAPVGLVYDDTQEAFRVGAECAALTHGAPEAYLPAGVFAAVISELMKGCDIPSSIETAMKILQGYSGHESTYVRLKKAIELSQTDMCHRDAIVALGYGFTGDEALAISLYCVLKNSNNLKDALIMAVNHSGDSDSTGAITGNILGASIGLDTVPKEWIECLELKDEIIKTAAELCEIE